MNDRGAERAMVDLMAEALIQGWAEQFPDDDFLRVRVILEAALEPLLSARGRGLFASSFDAGEARTRMSLAASGQGAPR
jgi:hypothetical protein